MHTFVLAAAALAAALASSASAGAWEGARGSAPRESKLVLHDGDCKVEREWKKDGEYKQKIECGKRPGGREHKVELRDGGCKVVREWKKDGEYNETVECKGGPAPGSRGAWVGHGGSDDDVFDD